MVLNSGMQAGVLASCGDLLLPPLHIFDHTNTTQTHTPHNSQPHTTTYTQEKLIREHFLAQTPELLLHAASNNSLVVVLDVPDLTLLDEGKVGL